jgi:hypothetical protein
MAVAPASDGKVCLLDGFPLRGNYGVLNASGTSELERYKAGAAAEAEFTSVNEHSKADPNAVPPTLSRVDHC